AGGENARIGGVEKRKKLQQPIAYLGLFSADVAGNQRNKAIKSCLGIARNDLGICSSKLLIDVLRCLLRIRNRIRGAIGWVQALEPHRGMSLLLVISVIWLQCEDGIIHTESTVKVPAVEHAFGLREEGVFCWLRLFRLSYILGLKSFELRPNLLG